MLGITITYDNPINTSIQVGDLAFYVPETEVGSSGNTYSTGSLVATLLLGTIIAVTIEAGEVYPRTISIIYDDTIITQAPRIGDFLMFAKDRRANTSSLKGYYAEIDMVNSSSEKIELFAIGLGTTASSN